MPLPPDISQRITAAKAKGFTDAQIQADMQRKYGTTSTTPQPATAPALPKPESMTEVGGPLGVAGSMAGVKHIGELVGALGLFHSKDKRGADESAQNLEAMNAKLLAHAQSLPPGPRRTALLHQAQQNSGQVSAYEGSVDKSVPTGKQVAGDVAQLALTGVGMKAPVGSGLFRTQQMGSKIAPTAVQGLGKQFALSKVPQAVGLGGLSSAAEAFGRGKSAKDIGKAGLVGGLFSGGVTAGFGLIGKLSNALTNAAPKGIYKTSARLEEQLDPEYALERNITGSRSQIEKKLTPEFARIEAAIKSSPNAKKAIDPAQLLDDPQFKKLYAQAKAGGEGDAVESTVRKLFPDFFAEAKIPEPTQAVLEGTPPTDKVWNALTKASKEYGSSPADQQAFSGAFKDSVTRPKAGGDVKDVLSAIEKRRAIQRFTPQGVMRGLPSTSAEAETKDILRGGLNKLSYDAAPDIKTEMGNDQLLVAIKNSMEKMGRRPATLPGSIPSLIQKTLLAPAIGTRLARGMYQMGAPGRALSNNPALQKALRQVLVRGSGLAQ